MRAHVKRMPRPRAYLALCTGLGLVLGWSPTLVHGPIPEKLNPHFIWGDVAVWAYYSARLSIGWLVGVAVWPRPWFLRGPLVGLVALLPPSLFSLAVPECGWP